LGAEAVRSLVAGAGVVHRDPGGTDEPDAEHIAVFARTSFSRKIPMICSSVNRLGFMSIPSR
jgi:hypothetical protein